MFSEHSGIFVPPELTENKCTPPWLWSMRRSALRAAPFSLSQTDVSNLAGNLATRDQRRRRRRLRREALSRVTLLREDEHALPGGAVKEPSIQYSRNAPILPRRGLTSSCFTASVPAKLVARWHDGFGSTVSTRQGCVPARARKVSPRGFFSLERNQARSSWPKGGVLLEHCQID